MTFNEVRYEGTVSLETMPADLQSLFKEYEEVVEGQMFSILDGVEAKIEAVDFKVSFADGTEAPVEDLQVFPSTGAVSFKAGASTSS